jgi:hypothetical protein
MEKLGSKRTTSIKIDIWVFFPKSVEKVRVSLKSGQNKECFT